MTVPIPRPVLYAAGAALALAAPWLAPNFQTTMAMLWLMVLFAITWDILGGQMGYNSFGNILYFGIGVYVTAVVQRNLHFSIEEYVAVAAKVDLLSPAQYLSGLALGIPLGGVAAVAVAFILGIGVLGMRGHYFAICTLGLGIVGGEVASGWDYIGAGAGMVTPVFPSALGPTGMFFYYIFMVFAVAAFFTVRWLYAGRFGLAINAIRDDEDKAEAMGIHTTRYKTVAWCVSAFFLGLAGGAFGHLQIFIDPRQTAFAGATFGVWMVLMAILGGKGTIWGPVVGAAIFHVTQQLFWTYLFGWQRVALGLLIVVIVVFFPQGIMGWLRARFPERFGQRVEERAPAGAAE